MKYIRDLPEVRVTDKDLERAIRILRGRVEMAGVLSDLRTRRECCTRAERRKEKRRKAEARRRKYLRYLQKREHDTYNGDALQ